MIFRVRPLTRQLLFTGMVLAASPAMVSPSPAAAPAAALPTQSRLDSLRPPEVRLRKLHLVRPDLIYYPIEYEVVC